MGSELSVVQATRRLGLTLDTIYKLIYSGRLKARKGSAGKWIISAESVEARRNARKARLEARRGAHRS